MWIIYAYTYVYVKVKFTTNNTHDLMVNGLRSRKAHFREESDHNMVNRLRSRESLWKKSDLNMVIRPEYFVDFNICMW